MDKKDNVVKLPDGSGFSTASFPLPKSHWIYERSEAPPTLMVMAPDAVEEFRKQLTDIVKYSIQVCTQSGKDMDFDPDALVQNISVGVCGPFSGRAMLVAVNDRPTAEDESV